MPCVLRQNDSEQLFKIREHSTVIADSPQAEWASNLRDEQPGDSAETGKFRIKPAIAGQMFSSSDSLPSKLSISEIKRLYDITPDSSFRETETTAPVFNPPKFIKEESGITAMQMGSVLHKITEFIDYERHVTLDEIEELIQLLIEKNLLSAEDAATIQREKIKTLVDSPIAERMRKAAAQSKLYRETPFVLAMPASQIYTQAETDEKILVHGIIDCHFEENDKLILLDFKSDTLPRGVSLNEWAEKHRIQLEIYRQALSEATKKEVSETLLYSFACGETVKLEVATNS
jgi:ATP-dependent helicase/nuclease subunit A